MGMEDGRSFHSVCRVSHRRLFNEYVRRTFRSAVFDYCIHADVRHRLLCHSETRDREDCRICGRTRGSVMPPRLRFLRIEEKDGADTCDIVAAVLSCAVSRRNLVGHERPVEHVFRVCAAEQHESFSSDDYFRGVCFHRKTVRQREHRSRALYSRPVCGFRSCDYGADHPSGPDFFRQQERLSLHAAVLRADSGFSPVCVRGRKGYELERQHSSLPDLCHSAPL